jgi:hypothetical protein
MDLMKKSELEQKYLNKTVYLDTKAAHSKAGRIGKVIGTVNTVAGTALVLSFGDSVGYVFDLHILKIIKDSDDIEVKKII